MNRSIFALSLLLVSGCATSRIIQTTSPSTSPYAPLNESSHKKGTVRYSTDSFWSTTTTNREDAYKKMHDYCLGSYQIVSERNTSATDTYTGIYDGLVYSSEDRFKEIDFECGGK